MNTDNIDFQKAGSSLKIMGFFTIIFGILAIMSPWIAGQSVMWLIGVLVIAGGLTRMFWALKAGSLGKGVLVFLIGVLTLLAGVAVISHPVMTSAILTMILAAYFFVDGFTEIIAAFTLPGGQGGKGWLIFDGVVTVLLGAMLFSSFPIGGTLAIGVFLGIKLLFVGMTMLALGTAAKAAA